MWMFATLRTRDPLPAAWQAELDERIADFSAFLSLRPTVHRYDKEFMTYKQQAVRLSLKVMESDLGTHPISQWSAKTWPDAFQQLGLDIFPWDRLVPGSDPVTSIEIERFLSEFDDIAPEVREFLLEESTIRFGKFHAWLPYAIKLGGFYADTPEDTPLMISRQVYTRAKAR